MGSYVFIFLFNAFLEDINHLLEWVRARILLERQESTPVGEPTSTTDQRIGMQVSSMNQEATQLVGW